MSANKKPWWYVFAKLGVAASAPIKLLTGAAQWVPIPAVQAIAAGSAAEGEITKEAEKGVAVAEGAVRLAIYLLVVAVGIAGCASQDGRILATTGDLKTGTLALMDKAIEPYSAHAEEIDVQKAQLKRLYDQERTRPGNGPTTRMWATLLQVDPKLPGSGIYPRFLDQWEKKNVLSSVYIEDKKQTVGDAFDKIISLESAKPQR
jgi:hypothetical protein